MPRHMFGDIVEPSVKVGTNQWYTVPVSILVHTAAVLALIVIPLMAADILPTPPSSAASRKPRPRPRPRRPRRRCASAATSSRP